MNGSDMRAKAAAMFGKSFMDATKPKPLAKNAAVASNKVSKDRPIPAFKVGGRVKADLPAVRKEAVMKRAGLMKDGGKPAKHADGGRIRPQIIPIALKGSDISSMGGGDGGQMRASLGGIGGSMRPDYGGAQGRMMQDLDREGRMTGNAGTAKGVGLRVGARFKDGGHVAKKAEGGTLSPFEKAFAEARKAGKKEFTFKGKEFNTRYKEEAVAPKAKAATPETPKAKAPEPKKPAAETKPTAAPAKPRAGTENVAGKADKLKSFFSGITGGLESLQSQSRQQRSAMETQRLARQAARSEEMSPNQRQMLKNLGGYKVGGKVQTSADTAEKLATEMGGMKCGGKAGKYAAGGAGKMRKGQCDTPTKLAKGGAGKVRKGMMTQKGEMLQAAKPGKGIGGK